MYCGECGAQVPAGSSVCSCGAPASPVTSSVVTGNAGTAAPHPAEVIKARCRDAAAVLKLVCLNPTGNLQRSFASLEKRQALEVGILFAVAYEAFTVLGIYLALPQWAGSPGAGDILKLSILGLVPLIAIASACAAVRRFFGGSAGSIEGDVFLATITALPFGILALFTGVLGGYNFEIIGILSVFALSYSILLLYTGCTRISAIPEMRAAPAVPVIIVAAAWVSKILFSTML